MQDLAAYTDSDYAKDRDGRKSTYEYVFTLSGATIFWSSKKQAVVSCPAARQSSLLKQVAFGMPYGCKDYWESWCSHKRKQPWYTVIKTRQSSCQRILLSMDATSISMSSITSRVLGVILHDSGDLETQWPDLRSISRWCHPLGKWVLYAPYKGVALVQSDIVALELSFRMPWIHSYVTLP